MRIIEEQLIIKKKTPFYGLTEIQYLERTELPYIDPPTDRSNSNLQDSENDLVPSNEK
mgnify:CR=1 FL=1